MKLRVITASIVGSMLALSFGVASADTLTASCVGSASATAIAWTGSSTGGVAPIAFLWSNGGTSSMQTILEAPGTYSMGLQVTDASSTMATTTCSAIVTTSATTSSGGTGSTLQQQIQALLAQITALQKQIAALIVGAATGTTTPSGVTTLPPGQVGKTACIVLNRNLGVGSRGDDVKSIQQMLAQDPNSGFTGIPTGFFGPATMKAMMRFQMLSGIASSTNGSVGPLTRGFFERSCGKGLGNGTGSPNATSTRPQDNEDNGNHHSSTSTVSTSTMPWNNGDGHGNGNPHNNY